MKRAAWVLAIGGVAALGILAACGGRTSAPATPIASATATVTAEPSASATATGVAAPTATTTPDNTIPGIQTIRLRAGDPVPLPAGVALYATDGVWEGPTAALRRYYRDPSGVMRTDDLVVSTYTGTGATSRGVVGAVSGPGAGLLAVALCHGSCYGEPQPITVIRSNDGGVRWEEVGTVGPGGWGTVIAVSSDGVLVRGVASGDSVSTTTLPLTAPQRQLSFPAAVAAARSPIIPGFLDGQLVLVVPETDAGTLWNLDGSGTVFARIPIPPGAERRPRELQPWALQLVPHSTGLELHVIWLDGARGGHLGLLNVGNGKFRGVYSFTQADGLSWVRVTEWLSDTVAIGRVDFEASRYGVTVPAGEWFRGVPAIIDFETGIASPIAKFVPFLAGKAGGPWPIALARGPFARVVLGAGECLNLRDAPALTGRALTCAAGGTLLTFPSRQTVTSDDGIRWLKVTTPAGVTGWAATGYLEY